MFKCLNVGKEKKKGEKRKLKTRGSRWNFQRFERFRIFGSIEILEEGE